MKKRLLAIIVFGISVVCIILGMRCGFSNIDGKLVSGTANGEDRFIVIPKEEQIFYLNKVHSTDLEQAHEDAFAFAEKAYQTVMLAAEYGVIDSFSFDAVQRLCDEMNQLNQEKQRRGEPIMGLVEYTFPQFWDYYFAGLKSSTISAIAQQADEVLIEKAQTYYNEHPERFFCEMQVTYKERNLKDSAYGDEITLYWDQLKLLSRTDEELFSLLTQGDVNRELLFFDRIICLSSREIINYTFEQDLDMILTIFLFDTEYDTLLHDISVQLIFE